MKRRKFGVKEKGRGLLRERGESRRVLDVGTSRLFLRLAILLVEEWSLADTDGTISSSKFAVVESRAVIARRIVPNGEVVDVPSVADHSV